MKQNLYLLLAFCGLSAVCSGQTNASIQSDFTAGVQTARDEGISFQGYNVHPERFLKYEKNADNLKFTCDNGYVDFTFHSENILHFTYYPSLQHHLKSWGITPSTKIVESELKRAYNNHLVFSSSKMKVDIDPITADYSIRDSKGTVILKSAGFHLDPVKVQGKDTYRSYLSFAAPEDEYYFGLGQHQDGSLNHRGRVVQLWHDYNSEDGEIIAVPFMMTNKKYAIVYDNPARTRVACGINGKTTWDSEVSQAISFYVILGETPAEILKGYGELCGYAPLPPKKALGYIQCKQRYRSQEEILNVAKGYVSRNYPIDYMVVDWFHWAKLGDLSLEPKRWPDPAQMNKELKSNNINCMISCWPRFVKESQNFQILDKNGWLLRQKDGTSMNGTAWDGRGAVIDATNPEASRWYWNTVKKNYVEKGFDSFWLDESEPDVIPHGYVMYEGTGEQIYNLYPYYHAQSLYKGQRSESNDRVFILTRSAYLGTHQFGTTFWSSDIFPEWDVLKRQVACGLNVTVSGMPYWSSDIGGWQGFDNERKLPDAKLLITSDKGVKGMYKDYPEMYVRWFQYGTFCPTFRAHGSRTENEVWSYGEEVEKILVKYLKLRYKLMPYIYSNACKVTAENMPMMRGLFVDYVNDKHSLDVKDEFLFGNSLLVAPVTAPGVTKRDVYLPESTVWYDFWSNKKYEGGKTINVESPIENMPLLVKAGSILPKTDNLLRADEKKDAIDLYIYPGADGEFTLYEDDGKTYDYEKGVSSSIRLAWNDKTNTLTIGKREGIYNQNGALKFNIVLVDQSAKTSYDGETQSDQVIDYTGTEKTVQLKN